MRCVGKKWCQEHSANKIVAQHKVCQDNDNKEAAAGSNTYPAARIIVHDLTHAFAEEGEAKKGGQDKNHHEEGGVVSVVHGLLLCAK